jgi:hypothetical protein
MIPTRFALAVCLLVPSPAAHSQTTDQSATDKSASAKIGATEFRAVSTNQSAVFEKRLNELSGQGFRLERLLDATTIMYQAAVLSRQQPESATKYEYKLITTRNISTIQKELDAAAGEGYEVRGAMADGKFFVGTDIVIVLERLTGEKAQRFLYRIMTTNNDRENEFTDGLHKAVSEGYRPIKVIHQIDVGMGGLSARENRLSTQFFRGNREMRM